MWPLARDHSKNDAKQKKKSPDNVASSWKKLNARLVEFHTKYTRAHTQARCSQLNQRRINLYWDKIARTCTNDTALYKMCACAMCMHCQCYVRYFFKETTKKKKIPVASSRFVVVAIFLSLILDSFIYRLYFYHDIFTI